MKAFCVLLFLVLNSMVFAKSTRDGANNGLSSSDSDDLSGLISTLLEYLCLIVNALGIPGLLDILDSLGLCSQYL
ncbi:hypothetical protein ALC60_11529 [Trachymyrmex zeteki]|uniref:Uncharacterized protein n=1 Tax=Mycetomoellerius zeteki TaxID=64791 RepID=A0A151WNK5_9HYME|nr:hypothetical protein ALC60_11529 [Trachymyrmex zeteki]